MSLSDPMIDDRPYINDPNVQLMLYRTPLRTLINRKLAMHHELSKGAFDD